MYIEDEPADTYFQRLDKAKMSTEVGSEGTGFKFEPASQEDAGSIKMKFWGRQTLEYKKDCEVTREQMIGNLTDIESLLVKPDGGGSSDI